ncbi:MAG TPA: ADOP family duplicated permease [Vicinamibacterales bacterium]
MRPFLQAGRALVRRPAFSLTTIVTLAIGIGITAAAFTLVDDILLRPLPFPNAGQLVTVFEANPSKRESLSLIAPVRLDDWNRLNHTFVAISGSYSENVTDTGGAEPERLAGYRIMQRYFDVFQMTPLVGRTPLPQEEHFGGPIVAVISEGFWTRRFSRRPSAVGSRLIVGGVGYTIVGVMPSALTIAQADVWIPAQVNDFLLRMRDARFISGVGRMKPGVTLAQARADLIRIQTALGRQFPKTDKNWSVALRDLKDARVGSQRSPLFFLFGAVALLLVIALANVAGLMLVQLRRRSIELSIRSAIGASRRRVITAVMYEVAIITMIGAAAGAALAYWLTKLAVVWFADLPRIGEVGLDARVLGFVVLLTAGAVVLVGLLPALHATRAHDIAPLLSSGSRGVAGGRHRLQGALVAAQIALGIVLATGAGLLVRSYGALTGVNQGFDSSHVLTFHVGASWSDDRAKVGQLQKQIVTTLQQMPRVRAAGFASFLPATNATLRYQVNVQGLAGTVSAGGITVGDRTVTAGYLKALEIPILAGETCPTLEVLGPTAQTTALVNRRFVEDAAGGANVVGRMLTFTAGGPSERIVGVIGDVLEDGPSAPAVPYVYDCRPAGSWPDPEYVVRAEGDPRALVGDIRQIVHNLDASRPVFGIQPLADAVKASLDQPRMNATLLSTFAAAALALAGLGLYAMLTLLVAERRRELGVRLALGATRADLVRLVIRTAGLPLSAGTVAGIVLAFAAGRTARALLFGVSPYDPISFGVGVVLLVLAATAALVIPARQASRVSAREMLT